MSMTPADDEPHLGSALPAPGASSAPPAPPAPMQAAARPAAGPASRHVPPGYVAYLQGGDGAAVVSLQSLSDLDRADGVVASVGIATSIAMVAAGIVLSIWSLRLVRNAEEFAGPGLKPRLACGGW